MTIFTSLLLAALAASGDPESPKGSCADYVANYRALLGYRAEAESAAPDRGPSGPAAAAAARDAARVFELTRARVEGSCRQANRSEFECVVDAKSYGDLAGCRVPSLPLVAEAATVRELRAELEAREPRPVLDPEAMLEAWVSSGEIEASPELVRAALEEPVIATPAPAEPGPTPAR